VLAGTTLAAQRAGERLVEERQVMAILRAHDPIGFRTGNGWKGGALLLLIAAVGGALLLVPALRKAPVTQSPVNLPAMSNPPPPGSFHIEPPAQP
jgi:hypothetical protein